MSSYWAKRLIVVGIVGLAGFAYYRADYLTLAHVKTHQMILSTYFTQHPFLSVAIFFIIYVFSTALSLPGALILTVTAGALFGFYTGLVLVSFASTTGATLAFLSGRFILRDFVQAKFERYLQLINAGVGREGAFYLFSARLIPIFPFFVINLVMGLTKMPIRTFFFISQIGMLPGTIVYVNAGLQLAQIESSSDILSLNLLGTFSLLGLLPLAAKKILAIRKKK